MTDLELLEIWGAPGNWLGEEGFSFTSPFWKTLSIKEKQHTIDLIVEIEQIMGFADKVTDSKDRAGAAQRAKILGAARKMFK